MKSGDLRIRMKELQDDLSAENRESYMNMSLYISSSSRSEREKQELLLELLEHLVIAQNKGKTAYDIFGSDLEAYCRDLLSNMEKPGMKLKAMDFFFFGLGAVGFFTLTEGIMNYLFAPFFSELIGERNLVPLVFLFLMTYAMTAIIFSLFKHYVFKKNGKVKMILIPVIISFALISIPVYIFAAIDLPQIAVPPLPNYTYILAGAVLIAFSFTWIFKFRNA